MTTSSKLKSEFYDLRSPFIKAFANFQKSGIGDKYNDNRDSGDDEVDKSYVFSSNFFDFCNGDICMFYFYSCAIKFALLKSAAVTMPENTRHDGAAASKISLPSSKSGKRDATVMKLTEAMSALILIKLWKDQHELNRVK